MTALSASQATVASTGRAELYGSQRIICSADLRVEGAVRMRLRRCIPGALVGVMLPTDTPYNAFFQNSEFTLDDLSVGLRYEFGRSTAGFGTDDPDGPRARRAAADGVADSRTVKRPTGVGVRETRANAVSATHHAGLGAVASIFRVTLTETRSTKANASRVGG